MPDSDTRHDSVQGWQPIESAPRDGTRILVARFTGEKANHDGLVECDYWHNRRKHGYDGWGRFNQQFWPATHWMPISAPPEGDA